MIESENAPTLCPRCVHFTKNIDCGCKIGSYELSDDRAKSIRYWISRQTGESSWTYTGKCPGFQYNGSSSQFMSDTDRAEFRKLLGIVK